MGQVPLRYEEHVRGVITDVSDSIITVETPHGQVLVPTTELGLRFLDDEPRRAQKGQELEAMIIVETTRESPAVGSPRRLQMHRRWTELARQEAVTSVVQGRVSAVGQDWVDVDVGVVGRVPRGTLTGATVGDHLNLKVIRCSEASNELLLIPADSAWAPEPTVGERRVVRIGLPEGAKRVAVIDGECHGFVTSGDLLWARGAGRGQRDDLVPAVFLGRDPSGGAQYSVTRALYEDFRSRHAIGDRVRGTVANVVNFGAFVQVEDVHALLHVSELESTLPLSGLRVGDEIQLEISAFDDALSHINVALAQ